MITKFGQRSFVTWPTGLVERVKKAEKENKTMIKDIVICEAECPACGESLKIYNIGFTDCPCKELKAELTVNWVEIEEQDNE